MKKILMLLAVWPFLLFAQDLKKEVREFKKAIQNPDYVGVLPGESPVFVRNVITSPLAAQSWGAQFVGGAAYREAISKAAKREIFVSVFDTGLPDHNDLKSVTLFGKNFVSGEGGGLLDGHGHATHVGGTIAGNPQGGLIAPAAGLVDAGKIKIKFYKVLSNSGSGSIADIYNAAKADLEDCRRRIEEGGFCIWNYSLGGGTTGYAPLNQVFDEAAALGIIVFCANGNSYSRGVNYPANYPKNYAIAAGKQTSTAIEKDAYSTWGPESWAIEPGTNILSTLTNQTYGAWSGTSMATPHTVSIAAVVASVNPSWNAAQVVAHMRTNAQDLPPTGRDENNGWGYHLFSKLLGSNPAPPPDPTPTCAAPNTSQVSAKSVSSSGAILNCIVTADNYQFRYRVLNTGVWTVTGYKGNNVVIADLKLGTVYELQCQVKCGAVESAYSPSVAFKTLNAPANPVKPYYEWKSYAMPPSDQLYMYWQVEGQQQSQTTTLTNITIRVYTNGYEWAQDEVMSIVYGYFSANRGFYLRVNDDNETAVRWAAHFLLNELKTKLAKYGMQFQIERICGETSGGSIGVRYCDVRNFTTPLASEAEVKTFER
jgi:hypothetical protein